MTFIRVQPESLIDNLTEDGHELRQLPYPFYVNEDGTVRNQEFWNSQTAQNMGVNVTAVIGFQRDLAVQHIDLWWADAWKNPQSAVGMYVVTRGGKGGMGVHQTAIASMDVLGTNE